MICHEMQTDLNTKSDLTRVERTDKAAKKMLNDHFENTWKQRELSPEMHGIAFLQAWTLLAVTAELTTQVFDPQDWFPAIQADENWASRFNNVMDEPKSLMRMYTKRFSAFWPIYNVARLDQNGILLRKDTSREEALLKYKDTGVSFYPECWYRHLNEGATPIPDWQHTLAGWMAVRRNLFADPGWKNSENHYRIISNAFLSMIYFFKESKMYFENPSLKPDIFERTQVLSSL